MAPIIEVDALSKRYVLGQVRTGTRFIVQDLPRRAAAMARRLVRRGGGEPADAISSAVETIAPTIEFLAIEPLDDTLVAVTGTGNTSVWAGL